MSEERETTAEVLASFFNECVAKGIPPLLAEGLTRDAGAVLFDSEGVVVRRG